MDEKTGGFEEIIYEKLLLLAKTMLHLYCEYAVQTDEGGAIAQIKGHVLFAEELRKLDERSVSGEEAVAYGQGMRRLLDQVALLCGGRYRGTVKGQETLRERLVWVTETQQKK